MSVIWQDTFVDDFVIWEDYNLVHASATGAIEFVAVAVCNRIRGAVAVADIEFVATSVCNRIRSAAATGAIDFTGIAVCNRIRSAAAVGDIEFTGIAVCNRIRNGIAVGDIEFVGTASGSIGIAEMTPAMHEALIDSYAGGAWLWLVRIEIPGYFPLWYARNTEDVFYAGKTYTANNFDVGLATLSGNGSVPRSGLVIAATHTLEDKINASQGACGGVIKIIRAHEDHLVDFVMELEQEVRILNASSDTDKIYFQLGIPNPLIKKIPVRRYSSKTCPYAVYTLFKGPECQYAGGDATCNGSYEDCYDKNNEEHWGGELGLDPNAMKV